MKLIIPCHEGQGQAAAVRPQWMLVSPRGNLMIKDIIDGLHPGHVDLIVGIPQWVEDKYQISHGLRDSLDGQVSFYFSQNESRNTATMVSKILRDRWVPDREPIFIKECDTFFSFALQNEFTNYVCTTDDEVKSKKGTLSSYACCDEAGKLAKLTENANRPAPICTGGYYFAEAGRYQDSYQALSEEQRQPTIMSIINDQLARNQDFNCRQVHQYRDWSHLESWLSYTRMIRTYVIDIDGVLVQNSSEFFPPKWGTTQGLQNNINHINRLKEAGNQILLLTARKEKYRHITIEQLNRVGLQFDQLIMECFHGQRYLINDFSQTNPEPSAIAINISRNSDCLEELMEKCS